MTSQARAWLVVAAATGLNILTGILYIWSILSNAMITELHWTSKQASLPYTTATVSFVIFMMIFGRLQDTRGPRFTATFSALLMGIGFVLSGLLLDPLLTIITFGVIAGGGIGTGSISTMPPALKWFPPERKGQITGIVVAGVGLSSVIFAPLANALLHAVGISMTFVYCGIGLLVAGLLFAALLCNPPVEHRVSSPGQERPTVAPAPARELGPGEMLRTAGFYKLWLMLAFSSSAGLMIIGHAASIARTQVGWEGGFLLVVLLAVFNALGRFLAGAVSDKIGRINTLRVIFSLQAVNMLLFNSYGSVPLLAMGVAVAGLSYGSIFSVYPALTSDLYGLKNMGANYSIIFTAYAAGGIIGPMAAAAVYDATGAYGAAYWIACLLLVVSVLVTLTFRTPAQVQKGSPVR
ncbi:MAG TPA: OFA family MFS transporter [Clostridia bacterium]|nr:OFA family MFS transporter [Clostridia bacterium]